ncbi:MAG: monothiol bacilliredoxin BrxC family protein [Waddliaceae bacterium]
MTGLKERLQELISVEDVDFFLKTYPIGAFFKAGGCHKTMQGFGCVEQELNRWEHLHMGYIRVIENREASNYIETLTGVVHQSPQFILMIDGKAVYDVDNWDITPEAIETALSHHFGKPSQSSEKKIDTADYSNLAPYVELLNKYVAEDLSDREFSKQWLSTFQIDSALRSTEEFELLNSLFGDVDAAIANRESMSVSGPFAFVSPSGSKSLKIRASDLLERLKSFSST